MAFENFLLFSHVIQASIWPPEFTECFFACELMGPHLLCSEENKQAQVVVGLGSWKAFNSLLPISLPAKCSQVDT